MEKKLQSLPIGTYHFEKLRQRGHLYVDKTAPLVELINAGDWYFLSRPRRFGKSLTLSTLDAMFRGKAELFHGLAAEDWVAEQAEHPCPVLRLDMSMLDVRGVDEFEGSLMREMARMAEDSEIEIKSTLPGGVLRDLIIGLYDAGGPVVVLIDEYDKPILDKIGDLEAAEAMRMALRSFYTVVKACDEYLRFVMLTGISKFTKVGVFSAMNNLNDISMDRQYGDVVGYTQAELERDFAGWIDRAAEAMETTRAELLERMKDYYDGFCFDGRTRLYNPFSVLRFFSEARFANYSLFLMLLRGAGMTAQGEAHTFLGRSDVQVLFPDRTVVLEFKLAQSAGEIERLRAEGRRQIEERGYAKPYDAENRAVTIGVVVIDAQRRQAAV